MSHSVHPQTVVARVDSHRLLAHSRLVRVPGALIVVGERNDAGADSQDHRRVDFAVSIGVRPDVMLDIRNVHGDHRSLFLLDIEELNQPVLQGVVKVHALLGLHRQDVLRTQSQLTLFHNKKRSLNSSGVGVEPDFFVGDVPDDGDFLGDLITAAKSLD